MGNPTQLFLWTNTGNYPAGSNPWNGQPLAVAPVGTYLTPGVKLPAENENYILGEIQADIAQLYANGPVSVASLTAFRALPVPSFNASAICTPEAMGQGTGIAGAELGGEYYYDSTCNVVDNSSTAIKPNAISGGSPGRWRLKGGPLFLVYDQYVDNSIYLYSASRTSAGTSPISATGPGNYSVPFTTGNQPAAIYFADVIDMVADGYIQASGGSTSAQVFFARGAGGSTTPLGPVFSLVGYSSTLWIPFHLQQRYVVTLSLIHI